MSLLQWRNVVFSLLRSTRNVPDYLNDTFRSFSAYNLPKCSRLVKSALKNGQFLGRKRVKIGQKYVIFDNFLKKYLKNKRKAGERLLYFEELITRSLTTYILTGLGVGSEGFFCETFLQFSQNHESKAIFDLKNGQKMVILEKKLKKYWKNERKAGERLLYFEELITRSLTTYILTGLGLGSERFFCETVLQFSQNHENLWFLCDLFEHDDKIRF